MIILRQFSVYQQNRTLISRLDLQISPGQHWAILGPNGSGKSTFLHALSGLHPFTGSYHINKQPFEQIKANQRARLLGLLPQAIESYIPTKVCEAVAIGRHPHQKLNHFFSTEQDPSVSQSMQNMDILELAKRDIRTLSGGEYQRMRIARLLCQESDFLMLDEPANHLDLKHQFHLFTLLEQLQQQNKSIISVLHQPEIALRYCSHALLIYPDGQTLCGNKADILTSQNLSQLYEIDYLLDPHNQAS